MENFDSLSIAQLMMAGAEPPLAAYLGGRSKLFRNLKALDPVVTAATFAALLTEPRLVRHAYRLELLSHLALAVGRGSGTPSFSFVRSAFTGLGVSTEDPPEDLMVELVRTGRGGFRLLRGTWGDGGFFLERVFDIIDDMPDEAPFTALREQAYALLRLSDLICERAALTRYLAPPGEALDALPLDLAVRVRGLADRLTFSAVDLAGAGIVTAYLAPFVFDLADASRLVEQRLGATELERRPVVARTGGVVVVAPSCISAALRRFVVESMDAEGLGGSFAKALAGAYTALFARTRILGGSMGRGVTFKKAPVGAVAPLLQEVDAGRYLLTVFMLDTLGGFAETGLAAPYPDPTAMASALRAALEAGVKQASERPGFREAIALVVGCGLGRPLAQGIDWSPPENWRLATVSAADLITLGWLDDVTPLTLFRLFAAEERISTMGVELLNLDGPLGLVGAARAFDGHLVPHARFADGTLAGGKTIVWLDPADLRQTRIDAAQDWDPCVLENIDGEHWPARREARSFFKEDAQKPHYACEVPPPRGVVVTPMRSWWFSSDVSDRASPHQTYDRWKSVGVWLGRAAESLDAAFPGLPPGPLHWRADFEEYLPSLAADHQTIEYQAACDAIEVDLADGCRTLVTRASREWEKAHAHVDNIAERALVDGLVRATALAAGVILNDAARETLVGAIVPDPAARQQHAFRNYGFRDLVSGSLSKPVTLAREDDAALRLGLGWRLRDRSDGPRINGKADCTAYLNRLVTLLEEDLLTALRRFDRRAILTALLRNHEAAAEEIARWRRTASAILALHDDKAGARQDIGEREAKLNAVSLSSRILLEIAICESPVGEGLSPGALDLSRLMSLAAMIFHAGGYSDAMRWDVMDPTVRITPLGDVHFNFDFIDNVIDPFAKAAADRRIQDAVETYGDNVAAPKPVSDAPGSPLGATFDAAVPEAMGAGWPTIRRLINHLENLGLDDEQAVVVLPRSQVLAAPANDDEEGGESDADLERLVDQLTFAPRETWRSTPEGFQPRDRHPWRFRRRLSVLRKPLLRVDDGPDPLILFAPGMVGDAIQYTIGNFLRGDFPDEQLGPKMRAWKAREADSKGRAFGQEVADTLEALGWAVAVEVKITKLLGQGFPRNYGDVDVLAWRDDRILLIECKDVQFRKTYGEVAEQLSDFRGEIKANGKPDYLRRHLDRVALCQAHAAQARAFVGLGDTARLESHLVFRNPVPMTYALSRLSERVRVHTLETLAAGALDAVSS